MAAHLGNRYEPSFFRGLIHDVVQTIQKNLKVDWTEPHREDVKAAVRAAVSHVTDDIACWFLDTEYDGESSSSATPTLRRR